ncbi:MAG: hypothetical protein ACYCX9_09330, partial [Candidatus Dormibacteria bacterium]
PATTPMVAPSTIHLCAYGRELIRLPRRLPKVRQLVQPSPKILPSQVSALSVKPRRRRGGVGSVFGALL